MAAPEGVSGAIQVGWDSALILAVGLRPPSMIRAESQPTWRSSLERFQRPRRNYVLNAFLFADHTLSFSIDTPRMAAVFVRDADFLIEPHGRTVTGLWINADPVAQLPR